MATPAPPAGFVPEPPAGFSVPAPPVGFVPEPPAGFGAITDSAPPDAGATMRAEAASKLDATNTPTVLQPVHPYGGADVLSRPQSQDLIDIQGRGVDQAVDGAAQTTRGNLGDIGRGVGKVALGSVQAMSPAILPAAVTAPLATAGYLALSHGLEGLGTNLGTKAGMSPEDAQETGQLLGAAPIVYGGLKEGLGAFAEQRAAIADSIAQHWQTLGDLLEPARAAAGSSGDPIPVSLKGPNGLRAGSIELAGVSGSGRPFLQVVADGKVLHVGTAEATNGWLGQNAADQTWLQKWNQAQPTSGLGGEAPIANVRTAPDLVRQQQILTDPGAQAAPTPAETPPAEPAATPTPKLEDARFPDKFTGTPEERAAKALEYATANPGLKPATIQRRFGLGYGTAQQIIAQAAPTPHLKTPADYPQVGALTGPASPLTADASAVGEALTPPAEASSPDAVTPTTQASSPDAVKQTDEHSGQTSVSPSVHEAAELPGQNGETPEVSHDTLPETPAPPAGFHAEPAATEYPQIGVTTEADKLGGVGPGLVIREVPISDIRPMEDISGMADKQADAARYAQMMREGSTPPPLAGQRDDNGHILISTGSRRLLAAQMAGRKTLPVAMIDEPAPTSAPALAPQGVDAKTPETVHVATPQIKGLFDDDKYVLPSFVTAGHAKTKTAPPVMYFDDLRREGEAEESETPAPPAGFSEPDAHTPPAAPADEDEEPAETLGYDSKKARLAIKIRTVDGGFTAHSDGEIRGFQQWSGVPHQVFATRDEALADEIKRIHSKIDATAAGTAGTAATKTHIAVAKSMVKWLDGKASKLTTPQGTSAEGQPGPTIEPDGSQRPSAARSGDSEALGDVSAAIDGRTQSDGRTVADGGGSAESHSGPADRADEQKGGEPSLQPGVGTGEGRVGVSAGGNLSQESTQRDYRITDADETGQGTTRQKLERNLAAIRLVKALEAESRPATPAEQTVLAKFVGWGGLKDVFDKYQGRDFSGAREELQSLLTPEEYAAAEKSVYNAHYTSPEIVRAMWDAVRHFGFTPNASILEPAIGAGNFFGLQPDELLPARRTGVELDSMTGAIAKALYPDSNIQVTGFERIALPHNFFDLAISNVPFGNVGVFDPKYPKIVTQAIHNYFFVKGLDLVRPGGIVAFVTSSYTMDALAWMPLRERLEAQADLLGAIRLPNTAFKSNAGMEVTTDIIFLQKRAPGTEAKGERWTALDEVRSSDDKPIRVNEYYAAHPDMMLGKMELSGKMRHGGGSEPTLEGKLTPELLAGAIAKLPGKLYHAWSAQEDQREGISAFDLGDQVKDGGYAVKDGVLAQREGAIYRPLNVSKTVGERIKGMIALRDAVREVRRTQIDEAPDKEIKTARKTLEKLYDAFVKKHGFVNVRANVSAFQQDPDFQNIQALENYDSDEGTASKTDIFTERTIQQAKSATHVDRADEALAVTLNDLGRIDWDRMQQLTGKTPEELREEMRGQVYKNPATRKWETQDEYLSGNVRIKLEEAQAASEADPSYEPNVEALRKVQPEDLPQSDIRVNLGAAWIPASEVGNFVREVLDISKPEVRYSPTVATWTVAVKDKWEKDRAANASVWGTKNFYGHELLDMALNSRTPNVYQTNSDGSRTLDPIATATAVAMQDAIRNRFTEWVWEQPKRAKDLAARYNKEFNGLRGREFDGSHLTLPGSNPAIQMRPHQLNAIWRGIQTGNTLLAHEVGAGKTYEMVALAMESRRLGLARKPMLVVPNHMLEQFGGEFKQLYANAKLLVIGRDQLEAGKRALALARIANGNWDAVIVAHSSFARVGVSDKTFNTYMARQTAILRKALEELEAEGDGGKKPSRTFKEIQKAIERLAVKIERRAKRENKDKGLTFEELGVDMLLVDEAHAYKKLPIVTKRTRVAGLPQGESQRAMDMHMKTEYVSAPSGGKRGVVFATGTPVTNTLAEMYNMQRFLQPATLRDMGIEHFDAWANTFARAERSVELDITGGEYRENTRFSRFVNMPELARVFRMVADVKTAADLKLPTPDVETGATQAIVAEATDDMRAFVKDLMERAKAIRGGGVDPKVDNMLKIASAGKKAALDMRLVDPQAEDAPGSKVNLAVKSILDIWKDTKADSLTQMVFCDLSTPKSSKGKKKAAPKPAGDDDTAEEQDSYEPEAEKADEEAAGEKAGFSVYDDMKAKLIAGGIPSHEIAFIHDYDKDAEKKRLFRAVNKGKVRVIFGSTEKMGVGTNVQKKLIALHEMDTPWRPADITQREGRIKRQGNGNPVIKIYQYLTEGSLDSFSWQTITSKAGMVGQAMNGNLNLREVEDIGLSIPTAAEFMGMASGDPIIREQIGVNAELGRLQAQRAGHARQVLDTKSAMTQLPERIANAEKMIAEIRADVATAEAHKDAGFTIEKTTFKGDTARADAAAALHAALDSQRGPRKPVQVGTYRGLKLTTRSGFQADSYPSLTIQGAYTTQANTNAEDPMSAIASVEAVVRNLAGRVAGWQKDLDEDTRKLAGLEKIKDKKFPFEGRFQELLQRKAEIEAKLAATAAEKATVSSDDGEAKAPSAAKPDDATTKFVLKVVRELTDNSTTWRLTLADLRDGLPDLTRAQQDAAIKALVGNGQIHLYKEDNSEEITNSPRLKAAELELVGDGSAPRHIVYLTRDGQAKPTSVTLGSGFGALQPYYEKFLDNTLTPTAKQVAEVLALAKDDIFKVLAPGARAGAEQAHLIVRKNAAELARSTDRAETALRVAGKYFDKQTPAENYAFIDAMEAGDPQAVAGLDSVAKMLRTMLDTRREAVQKLGKGKLDNFIENYFPHIWQHPDQARTAIVNQSKKNLDGAKSFLKKRTIETMSDGLALGLIPVSDNPVDLALLKIREMDKYLMGHHILAELKGAGQLQFKRATAAMPEGYKAIDDRAATVYGTPSHAGALQVEGHWVAPEPAARVVNNLLSPGLREKSMLFRGFLGAGNLLNQAQLGFSAFHLAFTTVDVATSKLALAIYQLGHGNPLKALKSAALVPVSPITNVMRGHQMLKEWNAPGSQSALIGELVDAAVQAGGRARQDSFYETQITKNMMAAFRAHKWFMGGIRVPFAAIEQAARPIMEYIVPRQKMGVFADLAQYELERLGTHASDPDVQAALARAWDSVDNRLGQLVYDNLAWNKAVKDLAMVSVRSVGWNVGTVREVGGGIGDALKLGTGHSPDGLSTRTSYLIALNIIAGLIGFGLYYLWHGHAPRHLKDYYFPTDAHGKRWSLPTYVKDELAWATDPVRTAESKVHPLVSMLVEMLSNRDFFEKPIMNKHHSLVKRAEEEALFVAKQFLPLGLRPSEKKNAPSTPARERALRFIGITPAPKSLDQIGK